ncbi:hypothetical protein QLQ12_00660 [Actinoplanes sp. NEAU-A12]|uniref:Uncharacterized protein n=1 Tax=Actinoplanes sandaracinus TaxID=3045177 RepID=A0ABT6WBM0_9ACTN|nr:hypothetical protein [Actinoplanes sandaracinus]MDI6097118.1 hypothetical protein [Actinoplanes sandaracinus]
MSHDLDERIAAALQARACSGGGIDPEPLVRHARRHGGRIKRRRRALAAFGTATAAAVMAVTVLVTPDLDLPGPPPAAAPSLPGSPGSPGAVARPDLVGADPGTLHFTARDLVAGADHVTWSSGAGSESVEARGGSTSALFQLAGSEKSLNEAGKTLGSSGKPVTKVEVAVGGQPGRAWVDSQAVEAATGESGRSGESSESGESGESGNWTVRWQPAEGLWASLQILGTDQAGLLAAAGGIRFDSAQRCVVPFRLTDLPAGMRTLSCSVKLGARGFEEGSLLAGDAQRWFNVRVERSSPEWRPTETEGDLTAGPYQVEREGNRALKMIVHSCFVGLIRDGWGSWGNGVTEPEAVRVLAGYRPAADLGDVATW